jgi:hypothetical protein
MRRLRAAGDGALGRDGPVRAALLRQLLIAGRADEAASVRAAMERDGLDAPRLTEAELLRVRKRRVGRLARQAGAEGRAAALATWRSLLSAASEAAEIPNSAASAGAVEGSALARARAAVSDLCAEIVALGRTPDEARAFAAAAEAVGARVDAASRTAMARAAVLWARPAEARAAGCPKPPNGKAGAHPDAAVLAAILERTDEEAFSGAGLSLAEADAEADHVSRARARELRRLCLEGAEGRAAAAEMLDALDAEGQLCLRCLEERRELQSMPGPAASEACPDYFSLYAGGDE